MTHPAPGIPTQIAHPRRAVMRTVVQIVIGLAAAMPFIVAQIGFDASVPIIGLILAVSAVLTRIMSIPAVDVLLTKYLRLGAEP